MRVRLAIFWSVILTLLLPLSFLSEPASASRALASDAPATITVYCGRGKTLVEPLLKTFEERTGIRAEVRYADTTDLANLILQEGRRSPADVFFAQDPGALGAVESAGLLATLPATTLERVQAGSRSPKDAWVGVSGRARVVAYSTRRVERDALPSTIFDLTSPEWKGRIGWAPTNASFQLFVTALRKVYGDEATRKWLVDMKANGARDYPSNRPIIQAIADGQIDAGLVNHYYLVAMRKDRPDIPVENHLLSGDLGGLMSVAGVGILKSSRNAAAAQRFVEFLLSDEAQRYFAEQTGEFPLAGNVDPAVVTPLEGAAATLDLGSLNDRQGTLELLRSAGVLP